MDSSPARTHVGDRRIAAGVHGWLESPAPGHMIQDCVFVGGWAFASGARIVEMWADAGRERRPLRTRLRREDVARAYPDEPHALDSGFSAYLEFGAGGMPASLTITAALDDGRTVRLFSRRLATAQSAIASIVSALHDVAARPRLLASPRAWRAAWHLVSRRRTRADGAVAEATGDAATLDRLSRAALDNFLASNARLALPASSTPRVSVVIVGWNRADLTLGCLRALAVQTDVPFDTIVVDNASTDETPRLLAQVDGITVVTHRENAGFTVGANAGAANARGEYLLFLNNDAELLPGALASLVHTASRPERIGAVGGKLVFPDGRLQEAGSIVWADGSCDAYGRGGDPLAPEFTFERRVDFCSGAMLLTPRALFHELGGFDERYKPAYYEDADYCARLWTRGYAVVYQPRATAIHREFGSAASRHAGIELQRTRRAIFASAHRDWLTRQSPRDAGALAARSHPHGEPALIFIDDGAPDPRLGAGFPRAAAMVRAFRDLGYRVTVYATSGTGPRACPNMPDVEVVTGGPAWLRSFLLARRGVDVVVVSRPHNMEYVKAAAGADLAAVGAPCVYDAEAVFALRSIGARALAGEPPDDDERRALIDAELTLVRGCAAVLVVGDDEHRLFASASSAPVFVVPHAVQSAATCTSMHDRRTMLFVGAFGARTPNDDAMDFFIGQVLPLLRARGCDAPLAIAGAGMPARLTGAAAAGVALHGAVDDLTPLYGDARVFVAPMRFGAGIPLKAIEAAARGVPIVGSTLVARQLGWTSGVELLAADAPADMAAAIASLCGDAELWTRIRGAALARIERDYTAERLASAIGDALRTATAADPRRRVSNGRDR